MRPLNTKKILRIGVELEFAVGVRKAGNWSCNLNADLLVISGVNSGLALALALRLPA